MFDSLVLTPADTGPVELAERQQASTPAPSALLLRARAIELLLARGFVLAGKDAMGLPCYRSPSGSALIAVGSCRCLAYSKVGGRLRVVAAAKTSVLVCRITSPGR